jgi:hypothetical protein
VQCTFLSCNDFRCFPKPDTLVDGESLIPRPPPLPISPLLGIVFCVVLLAFCSSIQLFSSRSHQLSGMVKPFKFSGCSVWCYLGYGLHRVLSPSATLLFLKYVQVIVRKVPLQSSLVYVRSQMKIGKIQNIDKRPNRSGLLEACALVGDRVLGTLREVSSGQNAHPFFSSFN